MPDRLDGGLLHFKSMWSPTPCVDNGMNQKSYLLPPLINDESA
jgi:hypothetical protein